MGRELDRIFDDLQRARTHLERWIGQFHYKELIDSKLYKWSKGKALWQLIARCSYENEARYLPALTRFVTNQSQPIIPLTEIEKRE